MKLRHKHNGGLAEVDVRLGALLIARGEWEDAAPVAKAPQRRRGRPRKTPEVQTWPTLTQPT